MSRQGSHCWLKQLVTICAIVILLSLVGHFYADLTGNPVDAWLTVDLHGSFSLAEPIVLAVSLVVTTILTQMYRRQTLWYSPPVTPPPIFGQESIRPDTDDPHWP